MSLTYGLKNARDLLAKLERDAELLRNEVSTDRFFNFVVTAYSLADWVQNDPSVPLNAKADLTLFRSTNEIQICRDLANASKHFQLDPKRNPSPTVKSAHSDQGFGLGRFGAGAYGVGEEEIIVWLSTGTNIKGLDLIESTLRVWEHFFARHGM
jgi:hypothetical protein